VSTNGELALVERLRADLCALVAVDVVALPDAALRSELVELCAAANQLNAAIASRVASFDARGLADEDACRTTAVWLRNYGRCSDGAASGVVRLSALPAGSRCWCATSGPQRVPPPRIRGDSRS
jgi:hypothetical protein